MSEEVYARIREENVKEYGAGIARF